MEKQKTELCFKIAKILPSNITTDFLSKISPGIIQNDSVKQLQNALPLPLSINKSDSLGAFINSEFNHDGDSYRSPWSNEYFPSSGGHKILANELRTLEVQLNSLTKLYTKFYYNNTAVSSVFIWEQGDSLASGFNVALLVKNDIAEDYKGLKQSFLDSINVVNVKFVREMDKGAEKIKAVYKICSTLLYEINFKDFEDSGYTGHLIKQGEDYSYLKSYLDYDEHCEKIGKLMEGTENLMRAQFEEIYLKKTEKIITQMRNTFILGRQNITQSQNLKSIFSEIEKSEKRVEPTKEETYETNVTQIKI